MLETFLWRPINAFVTLSFCFNDNGFDSYFIYWWFYLLTVYFVLFRFVRLKIKFASAYPSFHHRVSFHQWFRHCFNYFVSVDFVSVFFSLDSFRSSRFRPFSCRWFRSLVGSVCWHLGF